MATLQQPGQPLRPGTNGRPITVKTNSFVVTSLPKKSFYHYDVIEKLDYRRLDSNGQPSKKQVKVHNRYMDVINKLHDQYPQEFTPRPSYDGVKNMFSSVKHQNATFPVHMHPDPKIGVYEVRIALVNEIRPNLYHELIKPGSHVMETQVQRKDRSAPAVVTPVNQNIAAVMLLQLVVLQAPHVRHNFSLHSRAFYTRSEAKNLSGGLEVLSGFFQSVRPFLGKYLVNVDKTYAAFYKPGSLLNLGIEYLRSQGFRENQMDDRAAQSSLRTFLRGLKVYVVPGATRSDVPPRGQSCRVVEIKNIHSNVGFITFNGPHGETTIKDYWQQAHSSMLQYPRAFGISSGRDAIFPAEKCFVLPGQRFSRKLSPNDMRQFLSVSASKPIARIASIEGAIKGEELGYGSSSWMREADIRIDSQALQIRGREVVPPQVGYGKGVTLNVAGGKWNAVKQTLFATRQIAAIAVLDFDSQSNNVPAHVQAFVEKMLDKLFELGMVMDRKRFVYQAGNQQSPTESMDRIYQESARKLSPNRDGSPAWPNIIIVILPAEAGPIRHAIKYHGDVIRGVATQCVRNGKYNKVRDPDRASTRDWNALDQYCSNVALKINTKLGGTNSIFRSPSAEKCLVHSMVVGCDISHPAPGVRNRPSIAGLVASIDPVLTRYTAHVRCQDPRQEVLEDLQGMLLGAIQDFRARAGGNVPERIIIFRDGVSEGEYKRVMENEINSQVEKALFAINPRPPYKPQIVFIVVGKRHHVRFFPVDRSTGDQNGNCNPGLVVDTEIVHSQYQSFYLLSHAGLLGTSRPSHYVVLRNDPGFSADQLQDIAYSLCHVYAPATRSVSIPAPVYYADKLCTHAADQFKPDEGAMHYDDSLSGVGSQDEKFVLEDWQKRLRPAHNQVREKMYFV